MPTLEVLGHPSHPTAGTVPLAEQAAMTHTRWLGDSATKRTANLSPCVTAERLHRAHHKLPQNTPRGFFILILL